MSSLPAKSGQFDIATYVELKVKPQVEKLLPAPTDWPAFQVALLAAVLDKPDLQPKIAANPNSCLVAILKCARLGLSLNPIDKHFALVPRGGAIQGEVQYQGWLHLAMASGYFDHVIAEVIYRQEVSPHLPLLDPFTDKPNHVPNHLMRDTWKDDDIVGAYCSLKPKGKERYITRVLSRSNLNKRRAKGAANSEAWRDWFPTMCRGKAIKALCSSPEVPKSPALALALQIAAEEEATELARTSPRAPIPPLLPQPRTGDDLLFAAANEEPLPDDAELKTRLREAIELEAKNRSLSDDDVLEIATDLAGCDIDSLKACSVLLLEQVFEKVKERT